MTTPATATPPADQKPADSTPTDQKPADQPADQKPADTKPGSLPTPPAPTEKPPEITYNLKLPDESALDAAVLERTAATARELGLSEEHAQKVVDLLHQEAVTHAEVASKAVLESLRPGGEAFVAAEEKLYQDSLADPELGGGNPKKLEATVELAKRVVAKFGNAKLAEFLENDPVGSHPEVLRFLANVGRAMAEDSLVRPPLPPEPKPELKDVMYPGQSVPGSKLSEVVPKG